MWTCSECGALNDPPITHLLAPISWAEEIAGEFPPTLCGLTGPKGARPRSMALKQYYRGDYPSGEFCNDCVGIALSHNIVDPRQTRHDHSSGFCQECEDILDSNNLPHRKKKEGVQ